MVLLPLAAGVGWGCLILLEKAKALVEALASEAQNGSWVEDWFYQFTTALPPQLQTILQQIFDAVRQEAFLAKLLTTLGQWTSGYLAGLPGKVANVGVFLLFFLFCTIGYDEVIALVRALLPGDWYASLGRLRWAISGCLSLWGLAQLKLIGIIALELSLGLCLLRTKHALLLALVIALVDMVPLVGAGLVLIPWSAVSFFLGRRGQALALGLLWLCVWSTRTVLEPRFVGQKLQLPGAVSLFSAILGASVWGFKGLILFPILTAVATAFLKRNKGAAE